MILLVYLFWRHHLTPVTASDGDTYHVIGGFSNKGEAAELLDYLNGYAVGVLRSLKRDSDDHMEDFGDRTYFVNQLVDRYNPDVVRENEPFPFRDTSFVIDKGREIGLCLRNEQGIFHDKSLLQFVLLHELTHIGCNEIGHDTEFWGNFRWLLQYCARKGLHQPIDYARSPVKYCGVIELAYNPYYNGSRSA